jgi:hypothetical protein
LILQSAATITVADDRERHLAPEPGTFLVGTVDGQIRFSSACALLMAKYFSLPPGAAYLPEALRNWLAEDARSEFHLRFIVRRANWN